MSLDVQIKVEGANPAVTAADKVADALGRVEDKGPEVGDSIARGMQAAQRALGNLGTAFRGLEATMNARMRATELHAKLTDNLTGTFERLGVVMAARARSTELHAQLTNNLSGTFARLGQVMEARARATETHNRLNNTLAQSFEGLAQAVQREKSMLDSIHGPMQRYEQDVQTLSALHARGAITANQYASALAKSRSAAGMGNPMSAVSLPSAPKQQGQGVLAAGASGLGRAAGAIGIGIAVKETIELADSYTNLRNRIKQVSSSESEHARLMSEVSKVARATRSDLATTGESYVRLTMATKEMGLSQARAFKIVETLNMSLQSSGASSAEAASGTLQLMQALRSGVLAGDEFKTMTEAMPQLLDAIAAKLGVSTGALKKMAAEGKLTSKTVVESLETMNASAKKTFDESEMTFGQMWTIAKNEATEYIGSAEKATTVTVNRGAMLRQALRDQADAYQRTAQLEIDQIDRMARLEGGWGKLIQGATGMTAATYALTKAQLEHMGNTATITALLVDQLKHMEKLRLEVQHFASIDPWADKRSSWEQFRGMLGDKASNALGVLTKHVDKYTEATKNAVSENKQWLDQMDELIKKHKEARFVGDGKGQGKFVRENFLADEQLKGFEIDSTMQKQADALAKSHADVFGTVDKDRKAQEERMQADQHDQRIKQLETEQKKFEEARQKMADGFGDLMSDIAQTALDGSASVNDIMRRMWMGMFKMMSQQALGSAFGGVSVPGFATGGSFMVGGSGGTDSQPVAFMASPNERVTIETPEQQRSSDSSGGTRAINIHLDERDALRALDTPEGERLIVRVIKKFDPARRGHTSGN